MPRSIKFKGKLIIFFEKKLHNYFVNKIIIRNIASSFETRA